jgi:hypothetical protein
MENYTNTDQRIHLLSQVIAKANRTYVLKKEDDSHTCLYFDAVGSRMLGRWIESSSGSIILSFNIGNFNFEWLNDSFQVLNTVTIEGKTISEVEENISEKISELGLNPTGFRDKLHFKIPNYSFSKDKVALLNENEFNEWKQYRQLANDVCGWVLGMLQQNEPILIWPHHFDTGFYVTPTTKLGIGFGFAMEDEMAKAPYFYISGYALNGEINYSTIPKLEKGRWETAGWKGAILPITEIHNFNYDTKRKVLNKFLQLTLTWYLGLKLD